MRYVIDASVALKWFFREKYSEDAARVLDRLNDGTDQAHAPELLLAEVAHVLRKRRVQKNVPVEDAWDQWAKFLLTPIEYSPLSPFASLAFALANERSITAYDAFYVQLATDLGVPVVTTDGGIFDNFHQSGRAIHVRDVGA